MTITDPRREAQRPCPAGCDWHTDRHGARLTFPHWVDSEYLTEYLADGPSGFWWKRFTCATCGGWVNDGTDWHRECPTQSQSAAVGILRVAAASGCVR